MHPQLIVETLHIVSVIGWMAAVFYLPRILINLVEAGEQPAVRERLLLMGRRLYRFGHILFAAALLAGLTLWLHFKVGQNGSWLHVKLTLVGLILASYLLSGHWLKRAAAGGQLPSATAIRWFNEVPVLLVLVIVYLAVGKPF